ncbi:uncharacterized protein LOC106164484 [Lingula anatina]|uniref:Uncharacterized protein LOC106164484 n=1 Tax=Lingula anatina TaxID=7574 RepID=A0A1S3IJ06_LINAN|nr:uncharacterized protein LOC106164484 [Lingula anatina]|eukprot:XP_013397871.1 uncharacterized protein LOC106164484 [Lingula anatina]
MFAISALLVLGCCVLQASGCLVSCPRTLELRGYLNDKGEFVEDKAYYFCPAEMDFIIKGYVEGSSVVSEEPKSWGTLKTVEYTVRVDKVFKAPDGMEVGSKVAFRERHRIKPMLASCGEINLAEKTAYLLRGINTTSGFKLGGFCNFGRQWKYVPNPEKKYLTTEGCK